MDKEELKHRVKNAIILLSERHSVKIGELTFSCLDEAHFAVAGTTQTNHLENLTKQSAIAELADIKSLFLKMVDNSEELRNFTRSMKVEYSLYYDYGMGSIQICREYSDQVEWKTELTR